MTSAPPPVPDTLVLASQSAARAAMLRHAGLTFEAFPAHLDEGALLDGLRAEGHRARSLADALAEAKAIKVSRRIPVALVIGSDQLLADADGAILSKADTPDAARAQLAALAGRRHSLWSAVVVAQDGQPIWRAVAEARLDMRPLSPAFIAAYVDTHWDRIRHCVGCYEIEGAGVQLFDRVQGDPWTIMGLPMLPLLGWLRQRGAVSA